MKVLVRFEHDDGTVSKVGMNNLIIINDGRIKRYQGIANRIYYLITMWHPYKLNRYYRVYDFETEKFLFQGKNGIVWTTYIPDEFKRTA